MNVNVRNNKIRRSSKVEYNRSLRFFGCVLIIVLIGILFLVFNINNSSHFWPKKQLEEFRINSLVVKKSHVYSGGGKDLLVYINEKNEQMFYIVKTKKMLVGLPNQNNFFFVLGGIIAKDSTINYVRMDGSEAKLDQVNAKLLINGSVVKFTTMKGNKVSFKMVR